MVPVARYPQRGGGDPRSKLPRSALVPTVRICHKENGALVSQMVSRLNIVAIIQARMGSRRLPGKVMMDVAGKPLLIHVITRAQSIRGIDRVVLATTVCEQDQQLVRTATECGIETFTGSELDVLDRYFQAAVKFSAGAVVRITADCPLLDPFVSSAVVEAFRTGDYDYVSNVHPPTFPDGLDTEVLSFEALERTWKEASLPADREHVTPFIRRHSENFKVSNVVNDRDWSHLRWTVDESADLRFVRAVYEQLYSESQMFGMPEVLKLLEDFPELNNMNAQYSRNSTLPPNCLAKPSSRLGASS